ncbi:MAG: helix-turn-helix domain-containing protein [Desulfobulbaceae bacterium]
MEWNGSIIKSLAKDQGITLKKLAADIGVSRQSVSDWVKGQLPKGNHLVALCKLLNTTPNTFFTLEANAGITVPSHRAKANAKVTSSRQKYAYQFALEYSVFFKNIREPRVVPVVRALDRSDGCAKSVASKLRELAGASEKGPITLDETFNLMESLGIYVIIKKFPSTIKAYAFYTKIHSYRAVFVDYNTNVMDLIFALLHESIHAIRDEEVIDTSYDQNEEDFCDLVANYVQFPKAYIDLAKNTVTGLPKGHQVYQLKYLGKENTHALYGLVKQIQQLDTSFDLNIGGADTNFKKQFKSIGDVLFTENTASDFVETLNYISPVFVDAITNQLEGISDRKLGELLGIENILDAKDIRDELKKKR